MSAIPIEFLHTDAAAHLPPPGHQWSPVRRYRTRSFTFPLAMDERPLVVAEAHLAPLADRLRRRVARRVTIPIAAVAGAVALAVVQASPALGAPTRVLLLAATMLAAWSTVRAAGARSLRAAGLDVGETLVLTHQRVLRFAPTDWRWPGSAPGTESPYDVAEIAHESIASVRALPVAGFESSGALEIVTYRGERLLFVHVRDVATLADRIRGVASAYAERGRPVDGARAGSAARSRPRADLLQRPVAGVR